MTISERKRIVINAIRRMEEKLCSLNHNEYDGQLSYTERQEQVHNLQSHLFWANKALVLINEQELEEAA
jgi:hypothetical protein